MVLDGTTVTIICGIKIREFAHAEMTPAKQAMRTSASNVASLYRRLFSFCTDHWLGLERQDVA
jgi:hypothetical protein